jgi:hypothetical protein
MSPVMDSFTDSHKGKVRELIVSRRAERLMLRRRTARSRSDARPGSAVPDRHRAAADGTTAANTTM